MSEPGSKADEVGDALAALDAKVDALGEQLRRAQPPTLPAPPDGEPGPDGHAWLSALEAPVRRRPQVPRLLLESLFLAACAVAAAIADLDAVAIAGVMVGAWVLVALIEWAASRADRRRDVPLAYTAPAPPEDAGPDPAWFSPPVEHTMLETAEPQTQITRLPPLAGAGPEGDVDATVERRPAG